MNNHYAVLELQWNENLEGLEKILSATKSANTNLPICIPAGLLNPLLKNTIYPEGNWYSEETKDLIKSYKENITIISEGSDTHYCPNCYKTQKREVFKINCWHEEMFCPYSFGRSDNSVEKQKEEIKKGLDLIWEEFGVEAIVFRATQDVYNKKTLEVLNQLGIKYLIVNDKLNLIKNAYADNGVIIIPMQKISEKTGKVPESQVVYGYYDRLPNKSKGKGYENFVECVKNSNIKSLEEIHIGNKPFFGVLLNQVLIRTHLYERDVGNWAKNIMNLR